MTETQIIVEALQLLTKQTLRTVSREVNQGAIYTAKLDAKRLSDQLATLGHYFDKLW